MTKSVCCLGVTGLVVGLLMAGALSVAAQGLQPRRTLGSRLARPAQAASCNADSAEEREARSARAAQRSQFTAGSLTAEFERERDTLFMDIVREAEICQTNLAEYASYPYWPDAMGVVSNFCEKENCVVVDVGHHFGSWRQGCGKKACVVRSNLDRYRRFVQSDGDAGFRLVSRGGAYTNVACHYVGPICCYDAEGCFEGLYDSVDQLPGMQDCLAAGLKRNYEEQDRWMVAHGFSDEGSGRDAEAKLAAARTNAIARLEALRTILSKFPQWKAGSKWYQVCDVCTELKGPSASGLFRPRLGGLRSSASGINTNDAVFVKMNERFENLGHSQDQLIEEIVRVLTGLEFGSSTDTNGVLDLKFNLGSYENCTFGRVSGTGDLNSVTLIAEFDPSCEQKTIQEELEQSLSKLLSAIGMDRDALTYNESTNGARPLLGWLRGPGGNQDWKSVQSFSQRFTISRSKQLSGEYVVTIFDQRKVDVPAANDNALKPGLLGGSLRERRMRRRMQEQQAALSKQTAEREAKESERRAQESQQREAERAEQRQQLLLIQEELKRMKEATSAAANGKGDATASCANAGCLDSAQTSATNGVPILTGPYGIRMDVAPGCENGAEYVLGRLRDDWLPRALRYYGDPFVGKTPSRVYTIKVQRNDGGGKSKYTGPSGFFGFGCGNIGLAKDSDKYEFALDWLAASVLTVCEEPNSSSFQQYVKRFLEGEAKGLDPVPQIKKDIQDGLAMKGADRRKKYPYMHTSMWAVFEELREKHPKFIQEYYQLKNSRFAEGRLPEKLSFDQLAGLLSKVTHENVTELFKKYGIGADPSKGPSANGVSRVSDKPAQGKIEVAKALQGCDFLLNRDFKKNAKVYLCLFSASWCPPCRREMPRIAKTYAETLKDDPDIELIHFSRDQNDEKALAWAKEHDVKFPVVKPNGGNPLDLHSRGIPHLFIVKADGTLLEEGHPMRIFNEEKFREIKGTTEHAKPQPVKVDVGNQKNQKSDGVQLWENGPFWAECNIGATKPEEYGYYFWWGDTVGYKPEGGVTEEGKSKGWFTDVTWVSSKGARMGRSPFDKSDESLRETCHMNKANLRSRGCVDREGNLVSQRDAATAHLGEPWRMPTSEELDALTENCTTRWIERNGVSGRLVTGKGNFSTKSIFLPAAGYGVDSRLANVGSLGDYRSSTFSSFAWFLDFGRYNPRVIDFCYPSDTGMTVRPVRNATSSAPKSQASNGGSEEWAYKVLMVESFSVAG